MYVPDFSQFVDQAVEFLEVWVPEYVCYASYLLVSRTVLLVEL